MMLPVRVGLVVGLLVVGSGVPGAVAATQDGDPTITGVAYTGAGDLGRPGETLAIWESDHHEFGVTVETGEGLSSGRLCLVAVDEDGRGPDLACRSVSLPPGTVATVTVSVTDWPMNATGNQTVVARLVDRETGTVVATGWINATVLLKDGDLDADGLTNEAEVAAGTSLTAADTDADGLDDHVELEIYGTSPVARDSDGDGLTDGMEVQRYETDPGVTDTDGDGLADGAEVHEAGTNPNRPDTDGDRLTDHAERNTYQTDPLVADTDGDGLGDGAEVEAVETDPTGTDTDDDGLTDGREQTIFLTDPTKVDTDGDGLDDAAEVSIHGTDPTSSDTDVDGLTDGAEVETHGTNPNAADTDSDGLDDGAEVRQGTVPTAPTAPPAGALDGIVAVLTRRPALVAGGAVALGAAVLGVGAWTGAVPGLSGVSVPGIRRGSEAGSEAPTATATETGTETATATDAGSTGVGEATSTPADGSTAAGEAAVLTNEERVHRLLSEQDGRMLQNDMVQGGDWSKATVSRVLSKMESSGAVTRVDVGKGNLVTLPAEAPENASPEFPED